MATTTPGSERVTPRVVGGLVSDIESELDALVAGIAERIRAEIPDFRRLPVETLQGAIRGNVRRALAALRELRAPTDDELEGAAAIGRERAEQGLTVDAVLHAYRVTVSALWSRFGELARERSADVASVLAFSETLWLWADAVMDVVATAHREVELEHAREDQQRRDAFVLARHEAYIGVMVDDTYFYVANSFGGLLRKPNSVLADQPLADPVILKLRIG